MTFIVKLLVLLFCFAALGTAKRRKVKKTKSPKAEKRVVRLEKDVDAVRNRKKIKFRSETNRDEVDFGFKGLEDKFSIQLSQFQKEGAAAWFKANIDFTKIVEYVEVDGIPGFTNNDTIGFEYEFVGRTWEFKDTSPVVAGEQGKTTFRLSDGLFTIEATVSGQDFEGSDNETHSPTETKFDIIIDTTKNNFRYTLSESRLALVAKVWSRDSQDVITLQNGQTGVDEDDAIVFGSDKAQFRWKKTFIAFPDENTYDVIRGEFPVVDEWKPSNDDDDDDGEEAALGNETSILPEDPDVRPWIATQAVFSFDKVQPEAVVWDPSVGVLPPAGSFAPARRGLSLFPSLLSLLLASFLFLR